MTTIVCDRTTMAGDTQLTDDAGSVSHGRKVFKHKGNVIGVAGTYTEAVQFMAWYKAGMRGEAPKMKNVSALLLSKEGLIFCFDGTCNSYRITDKFMAIGSGAHAAMGAMHMGATPREAVLVAAKVDANTGGQVTVRKLKTSI